MINAEIKKEACIKEIIIKGHAGYKQSGKDIVCASVSTAIIVLSNTIVKLGLEKYVSIALDEGYYHIIVLENNLEIEKILSVLEDSINELEKQFPKYIKIKL